MCPCCCLNSSSVIFCGDGVNDEDVTDAGAGAGDGVRGAGACVGIAICLSGEGAAPRQVRLLFVVMG